MVFIPNIERNKDLVLKRKKDPKKWSFQKLGDHFGITRMSAWEVWNRYKDVYGSKVFHKRSLRV